jgi:hypothetical protein
MLFPRNARWTVCLGHQLIVVPTMMRPGGSTFRATGKGHPPRCSKSRVAVRDGRPGAATKRVRTRASVGDGVEPGGAARGMEHGDGGFPLHEVIPAMVEIRGEEGS